MTSSVDKTFDLSGIRLSVRGLPGEVAEALSRRWAAFESDGGRDGLSVVPCRDAERLLSDESPSTEDQAERVTLRTTGGAIVVGSDGRAEMALASAPAHEQLHAVTNLLLAALAHAAPASGALILHAAGLVIDGIGFVLVGPSGSGKSTWLGLADGAGHGISEDLLAVDTRGPAVEVLALPFRRHPHPDAGPGRWPLGAVLVPSHGPAARLDAVDARIARAALIGNLPHLSSARRLGPTVSRAIDRVVADVPRRRLVFARDAGFVPLLRALAAETDSGLDARFGPDRRP